MHESFTLDVTMQTGEIDETAQRSNIKRTYIDRQIDR
jgi:hypothetical protein